MHRRPYISSLHMGHAMFHVCVRARILQEQQAEPAESTADEEHEEGEAPGPDDSAEQAEQEEEEWDVQSAGGEEAEDGDDDADQEEDEDEEWGGKSGSNDMSSKVAGAVRMLVLMCAICKQSSKDLSGKQYLHPQPLASPSVWPSHAMCCCVACCYHIPWL